jgi:hypothetical protein
MRVCVWAIPASSVGKNYCYRGLLSSPNSTERLRLAFAKKTPDIIVHIIGNMVTVKKKILIRLALATKKEFIVARAQSTANPIFTKRVNK